MNRYGCAKQWTSQLAIGAFTRAGSVVASSSGGGAVRRASQKPSKDKDRKIPLVKSEDGVCEVYSNFIDANWSLFDVRLRFGQIVPAPIGSDQTFDAEELAAITIAWPEAKILRDIMIDVVRRFEETNGEIKPLKLIGQTCLLATHY